MDRVKFGRALGYGARHAAKAIKNAAEAASAPDPVSVRKPVSNPVQTSAPRPATTVGTKAASAAAAFQQARSVMSDVNTQRAKVNAAAKKSVLVPVKQFSSAVFLQVMGTIFGLFALVMAQAVWRQHEAFHPPYGASPALNLYMTAAMFALFAWFCVSSFVRANRVGK
jgi:hypothetical protein